MEGPPLSEEFTPVRCAWEVTAGLIPGDPIPEYTKRWFITSAEWDDEERRNNVHMERTGAAMFYALSLQDHTRLNWVRMDWIWY